MTVCIFLCTLQIYLSKDSRVERVCNCPKSIIENILVSWVFELILLYHYMILNIKFNLCMVFTRTLIPMNTVGWIRFTENDRRICIHISGWSTWSIQTFLWKHCVITETGLNMLLRGIFYCLSDWMVDCYSNWII